MNITLRYKDGSVSYLQIVAGTLYPFYDYGFWYIPSAKDGVYVERVGDREFVECDKREYPTCDHKFILHEKRVTGPRDRKKRPANDVFSTYDFTILNDITTFTNVTTFT